MWKRIRATVALVAFILPLGISWAGSEDSRIYSRAYFGDPIQGLSETEQLSFERGAALFAKTWPQSTRTPRNAGSCVGCHSVPAAGGSGMSDSASVLTKVVAGRSHVLYRQVHRSYTDIETRRTPPLFGLGLLENSDHLLRPSGDRASFFGALAEFGSLREVIERAATVELGLRISSSCKTEANKNCSSALSPSDVDDLVNYVRFLAAPPQMYRNADHDEGRELFSKSGCAICHVPSFSTLSSSFSILQSRNVYAYTDFATHDVGGQHKVRTTPLWGINSYGPPYWHDGSARSIEEAITRHAGEATSATWAYQGLTDRQKNAVLGFLKGL